MIVVSDLFEKAKDSIKKLGLPIVEEERSHLPLYVSLREFPLRYQLGVSRIQKFFEGLKEGKIYATQCDICGNKFFPPRADCPKCLTSNINWISQDLKGELLPYTVAINVNLSTTRREPEGYITYELTPRQPV